MERIDDGRSPVGRLFREPGRKSSGVSRVVFHVLAASGLLIFISGGCIEQTGLSQFDKVHLQRAVKGQEVYARQSFVPENQYGIRLKDEGFLVGDPVRIIGMEYYLGDNLIRIRSEKSSKELYLKIPGRSVVEFERNLLEFISFALPGEVSPADSSYRATGHFHDRDHLQVLLPRTPLLAAAEPDAPTKAILAVGDRVSIRSKYEEAGRLWYKVEPVEAGGMGWVSADWVSSPVFLYDKEDLAINERVTDPDRLARFFKASLKAVGYRSDDPLNSGRDGWPVSVDEMVDLEALQSGLEYERIYHLLGPPDKKDVMMVYTGAVEAERLDVWSYNAGDKWLQIRFKRDKVYNWRFVIERR
jgi:hypothetical protein